MDDERLKKPNYIFGQDYFEELLNRIRYILIMEFENFSVYSSIIRVLIIKIERKW